MGLSVKGWKTVSAVSAFMLAALTSPDVQQLISTYPRGFSTAISVAVLLLRFFTTTPIFQADHDNKNP